MKVASDLRSTGASYQKAGMHTRHHAAPRTQTILFSGFVNHNHPAGARAVTRTQTIIFILSVRPAAYVFVSSLSIAERLPRRHILISVVGSGSIVIVFLEGLRVFGGFNVVGPRRVYAHPFSRFHRCYIECGCGRST